MAAVLRAACGEGGAAPDAELTGDLQVTAAAAAVPSELRQTMTRRTAVCDYLTRRLGAVVAAAGAMLFDAARFNDFTSIYS